MTDQTNEVGRPNKPIVIAKPKATPEVLLLFNGMEDIEPLFKFTGKLPQVQVDGKLKIRKWIFEAPCLIKADKLGNIIDVFTQEQFEEKYEMVEQREFQTKDASQTVKK